MERHTVDGTEMAFDAGKFLLKHQMVEARLESSLARVRRGHLHRFLTTADKNLFHKFRFQSATVARKTETAYVVFDRRNSRSVDGPIGLVSFQALEGHRIKKLQREKTFFKKSYIKLQKKINHKTKILHK